MLLLLRFLRVVFLGLFGKRIGVTDESVIHLRVWPNDIDLNFHLNDGRYVSFMGLGRADLLTRTGLLRAAFKRGWYPVVGGVLIRYRREIPTWSKCRVRSRILSWDAKWFYMEHVIEANGRECAKGYARGVLRSKGGPIPTADILALLGTPPPAPPLPAAVAQWPEIEVG